MEASTASIKKKHEPEECNRRILNVQDALEVLQGRWKLPILIAVSFGPKRFRQIAREVNGITDKMLSKELKHLELNQLVKRTVYDAFPPVVEYAVTPHGQSLHKVIEALMQWGMDHRKKIIGK